MWRKLAAVRNNTWIQFAILFLFALVLNREGTWVASGNENIYLLYLIKAWHPGFLLTDFTFQETTAGHPVFNFLVGWPTLFMPLSVLGWIGRVCSWAVLLTALQRIGRHFRIQSCFVFAGILLWMIQRQSFVANEWIIGTFEAKCVAYSCLLIAIDLILEGRLVLPAILTGLAFTFHSAVGLWGGAGIGLAFATTRPIRSTLKFAGLAMLFALPGVITSLPMLWGKNSITPEVAKFIVTVEMPFHLDPLVFGKGKIAVLYLMLLFNYWHFSGNRRDEKLKFLVHFQLAIGAFFAMGILFRVTGQFSLVQLFPFRVFGVMVMLMFFWHLAAVYEHYRLHRPAPGLVALGIFIYLCLPSPVARLEGLASDQIPKWKIPHDDFLTVAAWVRENVPEKSVVITPPWRKDTFYQIRRPLIAGWHAPRYDAMSEWRGRIQSLVGDVSHTAIEDNLAGELDDRARQYYGHLSEADVAGIVNKYGGDVIITPAVYSYPVLFATKTYTVYKIPK